MEFCLGHCDIGKGTLKYVNDTAPADIIADPYDIGKFIPENDLVDVFYIYHTYDRIPKSQYGKLLHDIRKKLKPGGKVLITSIDAAEVIKLWISGTLSWSAMKRIIFGKSCGHHTEEEGKIMDSIGIPQIPLNPPSDMWCATDVAHDLECMGFDAKIWSNDQSHNVWNVPSVVSYYYSYYYNDSIDPFETNKHKGTPIKTFLVEGTKPTNPIVPNIIHFIFGMSQDFGGRPFSFIHYINVKSAIEVNDPEQVNIYYHYEPSGEWWDKATKLPKVKVIKVDIPTSPDGRDLKHYAHRAGMLRLNVLKENGGIYLDVFCIRPFTPFLYDTCTLGSQGGDTVCDAVIMAMRNSTFIKYWSDFYKHFYPQHSHQPCAAWAHLACVVPTNLEKNYPYLVRFMPMTNFHNPNHCNYHDLFKAWGNTNPFPDSYCHHLWEAGSWPYLCNITPQTLNTDLYLHKLIACIILTLIESNSN